MRGRVERVLTALERGGVRYLVVGGVAVVLHGYLRTTVDLDLVLDLEPENAHKAVKVFRELGFEPRAPVPMEGFADAAERARWVREKNARVFSLWHPEEPGFLVDLFVEEPFDFEERYERAATVPLDEVEIRVLSLDDLIEMKRATGRAQDLRDADALQDLRKPTIRREGEADR
jgi:predicted nucleotidyltransferase